MASNHVGGFGKPTDEPLHFYWDDTIPSGGTKTETLTCTATVTPPAGQGDSITVSATKQVTVWEPTWTATGTAGKMVVNNTYPNYADTNANPNDYWLWAAPNAGSDYIAGMIWHTTIASPNPMLFGDGTVDMAQLITPGLSYTKPDGSGELPPMFTHTMDNKARSNHSLTAGCLLILPNITQETIRGLI